jgi:hypothetical protein
MPTSAFFSKTSQQGPSRPRKKSGKNMKADDAQKNRIARADDEPRDFGAFIVHRRALLVAPRLGLETSLHLHAQDQ